MPKSKCPYKWKKVYPSWGAANADSKRMNRQAGMQTTKPFTCPEGHIHIGNPHTWKRRRKPPKRRK